MDAASRLLFMILHPLNKNQRTGKLLFVGSCYMTCAMKLPMVCAASSCFCLVAWV